MDIKKYRIDKVEYTFNFKLFNELFIKKIKKEKLKINDLEMDLAKFIYKSSDAIHNWRFKMNAPSDLDTIKLIAKYFCIENCMTFLIKEEEKIKMKKLTDLQILSIKGIYDGILDFLEEFEKSNGFNDYWFDLEEEYNQREGALYDLAISKVEKVILIYKKEYPIIKNTEIYEELGNYIYNDLYDIFEGKLAYGYRFEAAIDGVTTDQDYSNSLNRINAIIDKYIN